MVHATTSCPSHFLLKAIMLYTYTLTSSSRLMTSHHVTCHVTAVSCASSLSKRKNKEKENQYKIRKIKEKKNKNC